MQIVQDYSLHSISNQMTSSELRYIVIQEPKREVKKVIYMYIPK